MAAGNSRLRLLYLLKIFFEQTDEDHVISTTGLIEKLRTYGIEAERKALYPDIEALTLCGYDIVTSKTPPGYFLGTREFELAELRLLSDAVQAAGFISQRKTNSLLIKLEGLMSKQQADTLRGQVYVERRTKCSNEEIYYNIDKLHYAVTHGRRVSYVYSRRVLGEDGKAVTSEKQFTVNPYALIWSNDHYYLVCNKTNYDNLMNARIDRMKKVTVLDLPSRHFSEVSVYKKRFDAADYAEKHFNMFSGEPKPVELICENTLLEEILDRFGDRTAFTKYDDEHFLITVNAAVTDGLAAWITQYGGRIIAKKPEELRKTVKSRAEEILRAYNG